MKKLLLGLFLLIISLLVISGVTIIWLAMANSLQSIVTTNITSLKQELIREDRTLSIGYYDYGVEMIGLSPAVTLSRPRIELTHQGKTYRFTAAELSFIGGFSSHREITVKAPQKIQLLTTNIQGENNLVTLKNLEGLELTLLGDPITEGSWGHHEIDNPLSGHIEIYQKNHKTGQLPYNFYPFGERKITAPFSPSLIKLISRIEQMTEGK